MNTGTGSDLVIETKRDTERCVVLPNSQRVNIIDPSTLPEHIQQELAKRNGFITRNSTCPCGSRKRFKRCCGLRKGAR